MYELVNTSLPNGLIPGTHGFAAVAMTKGLPDTLHTRLETYGAYSHRTNAHDATYFTENPVNWFHVTLPQGDHVLGRVAPADFDYTGRTNRLARLLVFAKNEMPAIGGASVLTKEHSRLSETWSGEARWLEADRLTPGRMRLEIPPENCDAPNWRAMFGNAEGLSLAKGFARLLAKNLSMTGRTIYFKTSTAHDADGTALLALFADLIDLLPPVDRRNVTFSTYPVALPQGTICHLRGVYDSDRIFDAATATQPWVDCEKGVVHNASLLPPEEVRQRRVESKVGPAPVQTTQRPSSPAYGARPQTVPTWMPPSKKDGTTSLLIGIITIMVLLVAVAAACGICLWRENEHKIREMELERQRAVDEMETRSIAEAKEKARMAEEERKRQQEAAANEAEAKRKKAESDKRKADAEAKARQEQLELERKLDNERAERERNVNRKKAERKSQVPQSDKAPAFAEALSVVDIDKKGISILDIGKNHIKADGTLKVFWYDSSGMLTNCLAGFVESKNRYSKDPIFNPKPDELKKMKNSSRCFCLMWYDINDKTIYWDWSPLGEKEPDKWFENTNTTEIALVDMCFGGTTNEVYKTWVKHFGTPCFTIGGVTAGGGNIAIPLQKKSRLKLESLVKEEWEKKQRKGKNVLSDYKTKKATIERANQEYSRLSKALNNKRMALSGCKDNKDKPKRKEEIKKIESKIDNLLKQDIGAARSFCGENLKYNEHLHQIDGWEDLLTKLKEKIEESSAKQTSPDKKAEVEKIRGIICDSKFRIIKIEGTKQ